METGGSRSADEQNEAKIRDAQAELEMAMRDALRSRRKGATGVRIVIQQRGTELVFGGIRRIIESEV